MDAQPDDEGILAALDTQPDAFAVFYRRHVAALLAYILHLTRDPELAADLCAETFAAALDGAHRFDPARGPAVAWLYGIARRLLGHAQRRGAVKDRARRRLGMAPLAPSDAALERIEALAGGEAPLAQALAALPPEQRAAVEARILHERGYDEIARAAQTSESVIRTRVSRPGRDARAIGREAMSDDFVRDLEEELVAAAAFRATRRASRIAVPGLGSLGRARRPDRAALGGLLAAVMVLGLLAIVAGVAITGDRDRVAHVPPVPPPPLSTSAFPLVPTQPLASCAEPARSDLPAGGLIDDIAVLRRPQREPDALGFAPGRLPIGGFDPAATRRAAYGRLRSTVHVVPSQHVAADGRCGGDDGPGLCVVIDEERFRCFTAVDVIGGRAVAIDRDGRAVGIVPDGIDRVTLIGKGPPVTVDVVENVFEARLDELAGTPIQVAFGRDGDDGCRRQVAPALLSRITALNEPAQPGLPLPRAARDVLNEWMWQLDAIVEDGARYWGGGDGVAFSVVPVVPRGSEACAPATRVCVVAVPESASADAHCVLGRIRDGADWRLGPLIEDRAVIYGVVPDGVDEAQVTIGGRTAPVEAGLNVIGGVLPFPYRDGDRPRVELISRGQGSPEPRVAVVDAGGDARAILDRLARAGYETTGGVTPGVTPQERTVVYWWPERGTREATARVAGLVGADERQEVVGEQAPRPVLEAEAPVVVVVGTG